MSNLPQESYGGCIAHIILLMGLVLVVGVWMDECLPQEGISVLP